MLKKEFNYSVYTHGQWKNKLSIYLSEIPIVQIEPLLELPASEQPEYNGALVVIELSYLMEIEDRLFTWMERFGISRNRLVVIVDKDNQPNAIFDRFKDYFHGVFPASGSVDLLAYLAENVLFGIEQGQECVRLENKLAGFYSDMRSLTKVGKALLTERNFDDLIGLILNETRKMIGADGGSIYVVEPPEKKGDPPIKLRFKKSALNLDADEFLLDIDRNSIAGYVAQKGEPLLIEDVYHLDGNEEFNFNPEFDKLHNYYTKSMMLIPMKNHRDEVIGVIQLINKKSPGVTRLSLEDMKGSGVVPFTDNCFEIAGALAGQAAMSIENYNLVNEIKQLFEGFVKASVTAIEQRDPTTSGHSFRVAEYTEALAKAVDVANEPGLEQTKFSKDQIQELRYASLLHDFGKVGVREKVLVKGKKLYTHELEIIKWRFQCLRKTAENQVLQQKLEAARNSQEDRFVLLDQKLAEEIAALHKMEKAIVHANEPTVLESGDFQVLEELTRKKVQLNDGEEVPLISKEEFLSLSIKRGTLDQTERAEIESHVTHTYAFLKQIPWTKDLEGIPNIAHSHHEKLDGTGYPLGIPAEKIPLQARMMTISDIFDALTAWDRPYKKAVPFDKALDILWDEAGKKKLDERLLKVFVDSEIYKKTEHLLARL
ncbi:MAG: HD domain-containing phosphohydrolase [Leptospirales bacterium]